MTAWLQVYEQRRAARTIASLANRKRLGVMEAFVDVVALTYDLAISDDNRADQWVGTHASRPSPGQAQRALHVFQ